MPEILSTITVQKNSDVLRLEALGVDVDAIADPYLVQMTETIKDIYKSKVPVNTGELRDTEIVTDYAYPQAEVQITDDIHVNSRSASKPASALGILLEGGLNERGKEMFRSQNSISAGFSSIGYGSPTRGWITEDSESEILFYSATVVF